MFCLRPIEPAEAVRGGGTGDPASPCASHGDRKIVAIRGIASPSDARRGRGRLSSFGSGEASRDGATPDGETRRVHADPVAKARERFATRVELENAIKSRRADVDAAVGRGPRADARALARAESARANATELLRLHLIIPSASDPAEMIDALQARKWPP